MWKLFAAASSVLLVPTSAEATFTLTITEDGGDVLVNGTGTLNLAGLTRASQYDTSSGPFLQPGTATVWSGNGAAKFYSASLSGSGDAWGSSLNLFNGAGSGDVAYLNSSGLIGVSSNYFSGNLLNSRSDFANQSFASMGLRSGTYTYLFGSGRNADSFVVQIGTPPPAQSAVPEPTSWAMMLVGFGVIGYGMRRRTAAGRVRYTAQKHEDAGCFPRVPPPK